MRILVTGGAGYIGSHTVVQLVEAGHEVTVADNLVNSSPEVLPRIEAITGRPLAFHEVDLTDATATDALFEQVPLDGVIHFAGLKAVGESVERPIDYYRNNLGSTLTLVETMARHDVRRLVFSSSATVYGPNPQVPVTESAPTSATNPYGWTKVMLEQVLRDIAAADERWHIALLRYFNPGGAHPSGTIGEDPTDIPNNLLPYVAQVAVGRRDHVNVYGDDYDTVDGTGVRDYIHVDDLARGHLAALERIASRPGVGTWNLGTGRGTSVLELIDAFARSSGRDIPHVVGPRRPGDIATCFADASLAHDELGWRTTRTIDDICADSWRWQSQNPQGYR